MGRIETSRNKPIKIAGSIAVAVIVAFGCMSCAPTDFAKENEGISQLNKVWKPDQTLLPPDTDMNLNFGCSIATDGVYTVVGAEGYSNSSYDGAAYVYKLESGKWNFKQRITSGVTGGYFGHSVGVDDPYIVVGAPYANSTGEAYVFQRSGETWSLIAANGGKLIQNNQTAGEEFGSSVAISGDYIVAGSPSDDETATDRGTVHFFYKDQGGTNTWGRLTVQAPGTTPASGALFGSAVSISGDFVAVGAYMDNENGNAIPGGIAICGAVYLYQRNGTTLTFKSRHLSSNLQANGYFGSAVSMNNDTIIVGARGQNNDSSILKWNGTVWSETDLFSGSTSASGDQFGYAVAMDDGFAIIDAKNDDDTVLNSGTAFLFSVSPAGKAEEINLFNEPTPIAQNQFGFAVAIHGIYAFAGVPYASYPYSGNGAVYTYKYSQ
jgi:hypothetical protein